MDLFKVWFTWAGALILGKAKPHWNFSSLLRDGSDINKFSSIHMVKTQLLLAILSISEPFLCVLEKFPIHGKYKGKKIFLL